MTATPDPVRRVLVVGGSGHLGRKVITAARGRGFGVRALLRPGSSLRADAADVEVVRGDLLDPPSLAAACRNVDAVITTAIGYSHRKASDRGAPTDRDGQYHLIDAARATGVRRFVFTSVLTCDLAPDVPHFHDKSLVEERLESSGLNYVALRPGAFVDQSQDYWAAGLRKGRLDALGDPDVRWSYIHTDDLSRFLVAAVDLPPGAPRRIDVGCDRPVSMREIAQILSPLLGREIGVRALPWPLASAVLALQSLRDPWMGDFRRMFAYILRGGYVADVAPQRRWLGDVPAIEAALERYARGSGLLGEGSSHG